MFVVIGDVIIVVVIIVVIVVVIIVIILLEMKLIFCQIILRLQDT